VRDSNYVIISKKKFLFRVPENRKTEDQEEGLERTTRKLIHRFRTLSLDRESSTASRISFVVALVFTPLTSKGELEACLYTMENSWQIARSINSIIISFQLRQ